MISLIFERFLVEDCKNVPGSPSNSSPACGVCSSSEEPRFLFRKMVLEPESGYESFLFSGQLKDAFFFFIFKYFIGHAFGFVFSRRVALGPQDVTWPDMNISLLNIQRQAFYYTIILSNSQSMKYSRTLRISPLLNMTEMRLRP